MKKPIAIILAAIMMFALCACGNTAIFILILSSKMLNGLHRAEDRQI